MSTIKRDDMFDELRRVNEEAEESMKKIDWQENAFMITRAALYKKRERERGLARGMWGWSRKWASAALAAVFVLGIGLGYILFHFSTGTSSLKNASDIIAPTDSTVTTLARLETTLARRELQVYFQQAHLLITDLLRRCEDDHISSWEAQMNHRQIRTLLNKKRYFEKDLEHPELLSVKLLLEQMEWLLYEMMVPEKEMNCERLNRLQNYVKKEKLLFKLRLVGRDIHENEV